MRFESTTFYLATIVHITICYNINLRPRVIDHTLDTDHEFPYVVALCIPKPIVQDGILLSRVCSGSLITEQWVLTAAHCLRMPTRIQYGDMSVPANSSAATFSKILKKIPHPLSMIDIDVIKTVKNDIALVLVEKVAMRTYGRVSAVDYQTMVGHPIRYAGYGLAIDQMIVKDKKLIIEESGKLDTRILQLGDGLVVPCDKFKEARMEPALCLSAKCSRRNQISSSGDSGGPVFYAGQIAGVCTGTIHDRRSRYAPESRYTPVSPYLDWIVGVLSRESPVARVGK